MIPCRPILAAALCLAPLAGAKESPAIPWDLQALSKAPAFRPAPEHDHGKVKAVFFDGLPWQGKATRVFAYYAVPETTPAEPAPGMVLVHGGGGSAFQSWVNLWLDRGYAAIAMDTCGAISGGGYNNHTRHEHGGPPGWGGFGQLDKPPEDQWTYHAVADVILAHSLLRSLPGVDPQRIGLTGISWGGYLTCITAGVDPRFKFAAPVYGCGFLGDNSVWLGDFERMGRETTAKWLGMWDPSVYLPHARMPMLWVTGTNDFAYPLDSLRKSYQLPAAPRQLAVRIRMEHGQPQGQAPAEIHAFADAILRGKPALATIRSSGCTGGEAWAEFSAPTAIRHAELAYTTDPGEWQKREWKSIPAAIKGLRVTAGLPQGTTAHYFNLTDDRGLLVSSDLITPP